MVYNPRQLIQVNTILYKIHRTSAMMIYRNSDRRSVGLQVADFANFQERQKKYKQQIARQEAIKNQTWLG